MNTKNAFDYLTGKKKPDREKAFALSRKGASDGIVLLENKNRTLPLKKGDSAVFFGRMQKHYVMSGTGSGGKVIPLVRTNIFTSLAENGLLLDKTAEDFYDRFVESHPFDDGGGWIEPFV